MRFSREVTFARNTYAVAIISKMERMEEVQSTQLESRLLACRVTQERTRKSLSGLERLLYITIAPFTAAWAVRSIQMPEVLATKSGGMNSNQTNMMDLLSGQ